MTVAMPLAHIVAVDAVETTAPKRCETHGRVQTTETSWLIPGPRQCLPCGMDIAGGDG